MKRGDIAIYEDYYKDTLVIIEDVEVNKFQLTSYAYRPLLNGKVNNLKKWDYKEKFRKPTKEELHAGIAQAEFAVSLLQFALKEYAGEE